MLMMVVVMVMVMMMEVVLMMVMVEVVVRSTCDSDDCGAGGGDIYIMMKCVSVCVSRKMITFPSRAERRRREARRLLSLA